MITKVRKNRVCGFKLSTSNKARIKTLVSKLMVDPTELFDHQVQDSLINNLSGIVPQCFDDDILSSLQTFLLDPDGSSIIKIENCFDSGDRCLAPYLSAMVASATGNVFGIDQERNGSRIQKIEPEVGKEQEQSSASRDELPFHADNVALIREARPEGITLACAHNTAGAVTLWIPVWQIREKLGSRSMEMLEMDDCGRIKVPSSFDLNGHELFSRPGPLFEKGPNGAQEIRANEYNVFLTPARENRADTFRAFGEMIDIFRDFSNWDQITFKTGDVAVWKNLQTVHSRTQVSGPRCLWRSYSTTKDIPVRFDATKFVDR